MIARLFLRIFIHAISIITAITIVLEVDGQDSRNYPLFLASYVGLICIFGRQINNRYGGWIPTICGLMQAFIAHKLGALLPYALLYGGLFAWCEMAFGRLYLHAYVRQRIAKTEWVALALALFYFIDANFTNAPLAYLSVVPVAILSVVLWMFPYSKAVHTIPENFKAINKALNQLPESYVEKAKYLIEKIIDGFQVLFIPSIHSLKTGSLYAIAYRTDDMRKDAESYITLRTANGLGLAIEKLYAELNIIDAYINQTTTGKVVRPLDQDVHKNTNDSFDDTPFRENIIKIEKFAKKTSGRIS